DFTGLHDICLADGSVVTGIVEGHLVQRISANGDFSLTFDEVLSYNGGTLGYRGEGSLTGGNWQSNVMTVGLGTGPLAGIHGQGAVVFTGPASLTDVIYYVYTPLRAGWRPEICVYLWLINWFQSRKEFWARIDTDETRFRKPNQGIRSTANGYHALNHNTTGFDNTPNGLEDIL